MSLITVVVGNPKLVSRTSAVARQVAAQVHALAGWPDPATTTIELAEHTGELFDWSSPTIAALVDDVLAADLVVVASPTFKASYSGLLKVFLDRFARDSLAGTTAIPVMLGRSADHALAVEHTLRPLLVEIGASVPTRGLYVIDRDLTDPAVPVKEWLEAAGPVLTGVTAAAGS